MDIERMKIFNRSKKSPVQKKQSFWGMIFVLPSLFGLLVFVFAPIIQSLILSLYDWDLISNTRNFIGIQNYLKAFSDERFWNAMKNTFLYVAIYVPGLVVLSLLLALNLNKGTPGERVFRTIFFLPSITSMAIIGIVWRFILDPDLGILPFFLEQLGLPILALLREPSTALATVTAVSIWRWAGFNMVILLAGLNSIPETYYEAAEIDGAGRSSQFFSITLPLLLPALSFVLVTNIISSFQVFDPVYVMTKGGPMFSTEVAVYLMYYIGFTRYEMGYASAIAYILFIIMAIFTVMQLRRFIRTEQESGF